MDTIDKPTTHRERERARPEIEKALGLGGHEKVSWILRNKGIAAVIGAAILAVLANLYAMRSDTSAIKYLTGTAERGDLTVIVTATGSVQPINEVDVSSELSGIIRNVAVDYNSKVKKGDTLAELDTDKLSATVESSRARLLAAEAKVADAEATLFEKQLDYERKRELVTKQVTSTHDFEAAKAAYDRAQAAIKSAMAEVAAAKADLKLNETNLSKARILSPIDGVVLSRAIEPGQTVASNLQAPVLFTLAEDLSKMEVQVDVDEADVGQVHESQPATFTVDAYPERVFNARIRELRFGSEVVQGVVTYKAVLETDNTDLLLRPGMTATAEIRVKELADVLTIPNGALRFAPPDVEPDDDRSLLRRLIPGRPQLRKSSAKAQTGRMRTIYVLDGGDAKEVSVTIGATDGKRTQILKGEIAPGIAVILDTVNGAKG